MFMMRRFLKDRNGASEIVGTALFLVILFFFFTNVFLWHDQVTREMDQVVVDRMNSGVRVEPFFNATAVWLKVDNVGGLDVTLSRLWIITDDAHLFADFEPEDIHVVAGGHRNITLMLEEDGDLSVRVDGISVIVDYDRPSGVTVVFRVLTKRANTAACSLPS
jgi:hypothetical protein